MTGFRSQRRMCVRKKGSKTSYVISMTSYPARFHSLVQVLENIMTWGVLPKKVFLNIGFNDIDKLPPEIYKSAYSSLLIVNPCEDLGPSTKLISTLLTEKKLPIVTVDDDVLYDSELISQVLKEHYLFPGSLIAGRTHLITRNSFGEINPYLEWELEQTRTDGPTKELFPTGVGMVLYPQNSLHPDVMDIKLLKEVSILNDDIWYFFQARRNGTLVRQIPNRFLLNYIEGTQELGLWQNGNQTRNDVVIKKMISIYGDPSNF